MRVALEGNIGSGKSSVLAALQARGLKTKPEPVDEWAHLLDSFYAEPGTWTFALQLRILLSFVDDDPPDRIVYERSPLATRYVFGQLLHNDGHFTQSSWELFKSFYDELAWTPAKIIYVDTPPDLCLERIKVRDRACERGITHEYLKKVAHQYDLLRKYAECEFVVVDGSQPLDDVVADVLAALTT